MKRVFLAGLLMLSACVSAGPVQFYSGPRLEPGMVSVIKCANKTSRLSRVMIQKIDGKELRRPLLQVEVLPYQHIVEVSFVYGEGISEFTSRTNCRLNVPSAAGATYEIDASVDFKEKSWKSWAMNTATGEQVDLCVLRTEK